MRRMPDESKRGMESKRKIGIRNRGREKGEECRAQQAVGDTGQFLLLIYSWKFGRVLVHKRYSISKRALGQLQAAAPGQIKSYGRRKHCQPIPLGPLVLHPPP